LSYRTRNKRYLISNTDLFFFTEKKNQKVSSFSSFRNQRLRKKLALGKAKTVKTHKATFDFSVFNIQYSSWVRVSRRESSELMSAAGKALFRDLFFIPHPLRGKAFFLSVSH
jgi:hypothetical protein